MSELLTDEKIREIGFTLIPTYCSRFSPSGITTLNGTVVVPLPIIEFARLIEKELKNE
jgi:hypothetical protein